MWALVAVTIVGGSVTLMLSTTRDKQNRTNMTTTGVSSQYNAEGAAVELEKYLIADYKFSYSTRLIPPDVWLRQLRLWQGLPAVTGDSTTVSQADIVRFLSGDTGTAPWKSSFARMNVYVSGTSDPTLLGTPWADITAVGPGFWTDPSTGKNSDSYMAGWTFHRIDENDGYKAIEQVTIRVAFGLQQEIPPIAGATKHALLSERLSCTMCHVSVYGNVGMFENFTPGWGATGSGYTSEVRGNVYSTYNMSENNTENPLAPWHDHSMIGPGGYDSGDPTSPSWVTSIRPRINAAQITTNPFILNGMPVLIDGSEAPNQQVKVFDNYINSGYAFEVQTQVNVHTPSSDKTRLVVYSTGTESTFSFWSATIVGASYTPNVLYVQEYDGVINQAMTDSLTAIGAAMVANVSLDMMPDSNGDGIPDFPSINIAFVASALQGQIWFDKDPNGTVSITMPDDSTGPESFTRHQLTVVRKYDWKTDPGSAADPTLRMGFYDVASNPSAPNYLRDNITASQLHSVKDENGATVPWGGLTTVPNQLDPYNAQATFGHTILIGTIDNPIHLTGDNFINGDLIIKGYVTGRGAIYANGKILIAGDIYYINGPEPFDPFDARWGGNATTGTYGSPVAWAKAQEGAYTDELRLAARTSVIIGDGTLYTYMNADAIVQNALCGPTPNADPLAAIPPGVNRQTGQYGGATSTAAATAWGRPAQLPHHEMGAYNFINNNLDPNSAGLADPTVDGISSSVYTNPPTGYPVYYSRWGEELWGQKIFVPTSPISQYVYVLAWANDQGVVRDDSGDGWYRLDKEFVVMYTNVGIWVPGYTVTTTGGTTTTTTSSGYDPTGGGGTGTTTTTTTTGKTTTYPGAWQSPSTYSYINKNDYSLQASYDGNSLYIEAANPNASALYTALKGQLAQQYLTVSTVNDGVQPIIQPPSGSAGQVKLVNLDNPAKSTNQNVFATHTVTGVRVALDNFATTPLTTFSNSLTYDQKTQTTTLAVYRGDPTNGGLLVLKVSFQGEQSAAQTYLQQVYTDYANSLGKLLTQCNPTKSGAIDTTERNEGALQASNFLPIDTGNTMCNVVQWISDVDYRKLLGVMISYWDKDDSMSTDQTAIGQGVLGSQQSYELPLVYPKAGAKDPMAADNYYGGDYCWRGLEYNYSSNDISAAQGTYGSTAVSSDAITPMSSSLAGYEDGQSTTSILAHWDTVELKYNVQFPDYNFLGKASNTAFTALKGKNMSVGLWPEMGAYPVVLDSTKSRLDGKTHLVAPDLSQFPNPATALTNRTELITEIQGLLRNNLYYQADQANYDAMLTGADVAPSPEVSHKLYNLIGAQLRTYVNGKYTYQYIAASALFSRLKLGSTTTYETVSCPMLQKFFTNLQYPNYQGTLTAYACNTTSGYAYSYEQGWGGFWFLTHGQPPRGWVDTVPLVNTPSLWVYDAAAEQSLHDTRVYAGASATQLSNNYYATDVGYDEVGGDGHVRFAAPMAMNFPGMKRHLIERALQLGWNPVTHTSDLVLATSFTNKNTLDEFGLPHLSRRYDIDGDGIPEYFATDRMYDTDGDGKADSPFDMCQGFIPFVRQVNNIDAYVYAGQRIGGSHLPGYSSCRVFGGLAAPTMAVIADAQEMANVNATFLDNNVYQNTTYTMSAANQAMGIQTVTFPGGNHTGPVAGSGLETIASMAIYRNPMVRLDPLHNYTTPKHNPAHSFVLRWDNHDGKADWPIVQGTAKDGSSVNLRIGESYDRTFDAFCVDYDYRLTQQSSVGLPGLGNQTIQIPTGIRLYYVHGGLAH